MYIEISGSILKAEINDTYYKRHINNEETTQEIVNVLKHYCTHHQLSRTSKTHVFRFQNGPGNPHPDTIWSFIETLINKPSLSLTGFVRGFHSTLTVREDSPPFEVNGMKYRRTVYSPPLVNLDYFYGIITDNAYNTLIPSYFEDYLYISQFGRTTKIPFREVKKYLEILNDNLNITPNDSSLDPKIVIPHGAALIVGFIAREIPQSISTVKTAAKKMRGQIDSSIINAIHDAIKYAERLEINHTPTH